MSVTTVTVGTYFELPLLHAWPCLRHPGDNAWFTALFVYLNEFLNGDLIDVDSFNRVVEDFGVVHLQQFVLAAPVSVSTPLAEEEPASVLGLHVVHFLDNLV